MSLFSGMKLASSGSNKPNQQTDSTSTETVSSTDSLKGAENKNESPIASNPTGFSFILGTDNGKSSSVNATCSSSAIELDESKSDSNTRQELCKTPPQKARLSGPADLCPGDDLNFDLDPIKITGDLKAKTVNPHLTVFDLQDVDFSLPADLGSEVSVQEDQKSADNKSESSFSFITTGPSEQSKDDLTPKEHQSSTEKLCTPQSSGTMGRSEPVETQSLYREEVTNTPMATQLRIHRELKKPHEARLNQFKKSIADVEKQVTGLSEECVTLSHSLLQKRQQLQALQEQKQQAVDEEDYERAEELHNKCRALEADTENISLPLPCHHPALKSLLSDLLTLYAQEREEHQNIKEPCQELITKQQEAVTDAKEQCVQCENIHSQRVQGARSELDTELAHLQLDREHLVKREVQLCTRIDDGTASLRQTRDALIDDRAQVQEEIKELEAKLRLLHLKETSITESIADKNQEIELVKREFSQEMQAIETEKELQEEMEIALKRRGERLDDKERQQAEKMVEVKETESSETKLLVDLERYLALEELAVQELTSLESNLLNDLWPEGGSTVLLERKEDLLKKKEAVSVRQKMDEVQQATSMLLLSQTRVVTLRQRVSDTEGHIAALNETKQLAVSGKNFSEARRLTDEIKKLTSEGQLIQEEMENLTQKNEETTKTVKLLREDVERLQEELNEDERQEETSVKEKLLNSIIDLRERLLQVSTDSPLVQTLQRAQLMASAYHIRFLCLKHQFPLPAEVEELSEDPSTLDQAIECLEQTGN